MYYKLTLSTDYFMADPPVDHEFEVATDQMAAEYAEKVAKQLYRITGYRYNRARVFSADGQRGPIAHFTMQSEVTIKNEL